MTRSWSTIAVGDKPADVLVPANRKARFGLLFLHDEPGSALRDRPDWTRLLGDQDIACICPHGGRCWWADRVCPEFDPTRTPERHVVDLIHPWMQQEWGLGPARIALAGVGMGGMGALRIGFKHPQRFPVVAAIGATLDQHEAYGFGTPLDAMYPSREH